VPPHLSLSYPPVRPSRLSCARSLPQECSCFVTDLSSNGTFVNEVKVGKGNEVSDSSLSRSKNPLTRFETRAR
jgi:hypothetical protein